MTFFRIAITAAMIAGGATLAVAQVGQGQNPTGDPRPMTPGGSDNPQLKGPVGQPSNPTPQPPANSSQPSSASRPIGPPAGVNESQPGNTKDKVDQKKSPN